MKHRLTSDIPDELHQKLRGECSKLGVKPASIIKIALAKYLDENDSS